MNHPEALRPEPLPAPPSPEPQRVVLHTPVDVRSISLAVIAVLAAIFTLRWASAVLIPLALGLMLSYALTPLVDGLHRWRVPRPLSAGLIMLAIVGSLAGSAYWLADDAARFIDSLPKAAQQLRKAVARSHGGGGDAMAKVQEAASHIERAAEDNAGPVLRAPSGVTRVQIERPKFDLQGYLWTGTVGLAALIGQFTVVALITTFLLASGNTFRRKLVKVVGGRLSEKKLTVQALDEISGNIQRYLLVQLATSVLVGVATGLAFWWIGLEQAAVWGVAAGVLNFVPYIGTIAVTAVSAMVAFVQFGTLEGALLVAASAMFIRAVCGSLLTPWLTSRAARMSPVVVFVGVMAWGWLWGIWGLLLGVPILMVIKSVCDRVDDLKPVGELLGN
ncbi:MAG TPA: AI-2E family transporter [Ideonella sp.]|nr:AI-2E family transporter [Ideonella sp.]